MQAAALWNAINQRSILLPAVFVFLWQVCLLRVLQPTHTHLTEHINPIAEHVAQSHTCLLIQLGWPAYSYRDPPCYMYFTLTPHIAIPCSQISTLGATFNLSIGLISDCCMMHRRRRQPTRPCSTSRQMPWASRRSSWAVCAWRAPWLL